VDPADKLTPKLQVAFEIYYTDLLAHLLRMQDADRYYRSVDAELWPNKANLGILNQPRVSRK
jgi:hypothetical protein